MVAHVYVLDPVGGVHRIFFSCAKISFLLTILLTLFVRICRDERERGAEIMCRTNCVNSDFFSLLDCFVSVCALRCCPVCPSVSVC